MKTFKNYIVENNNLTILNEDKIIPFILKNCQQWFHEIWNKEIKTEDDFFFLLDSGYSFFRGFPVFYNGFINVAKTNRRPVSTNRYIHDAINKALMKLGFTTHRGNSIFCTNSLTQSKTYGIPYYVFPIDGYQYLFSEKIRDLYTIFSTIQQFYMFSDRSKPELLLFPNLATYIDEYDIETESKFFEKFSKYSQSEIETIFEIDENILQNLFYFQDNNIKQYIFNPKKEIEFLVRPKVVMLNYKYINTVDD